MLCNEPKEIPSGTNPLPKADQLFLEKFCSRVDRSGGTTFGAASSLWKEDPHGAWAGGMSHNFHAQASPRKGCPKIKQGRSCLQRDSSAHYEPNRHKLLLSSHFSLERQFLPVASCPPPSPHTHVFQLCTADFNLELYVGRRLCLCNGWSRWEMHPDGSCVCCSICPVPDGDRLFPLSLIPSERAFVCPTQICLPHTDLFALHRFLAGWLNTAEGEAGPLSWCTKHRVELLSLSPSPCCLQEPLGY